MPPTTLSPTCFSSACACNHCIVTIPIVAMVAKHTMKKHVMLHLLECAKIGGIWDKRLFHPSSQNFSSKFSGSVYLRGRPLRTITITERDRHNKSTCNNQFIRAINFPQFLKIKNLPALSRESGIKTEQHTWTCSQRFWSSTPAYLTNWGFHGQPKTPSLNKINENPNTRSRDPLQTPPKAPPTPKPHTTTPLQKKWGQRFLHLVDLGGGVAGQEGQTNHDVLFKCKGWPTKSFLRSRSNTEADVHVDEVRTSRLGGDIFVH